MVKERPDDSYLLLGRNESGKTHISWALYRHAVVMKRRPVACTLNDLMVQYKDWEMMSVELRMIAERDRTDDRPLVLPKDLKENGKPQTLILDEFDKAKVSEFTSRMLVELLTAARDFGHQLIVMSNKHWDELWTIWGQLDETRGNTIMTRLKMCKLIEMF